MRQALHVLTVIGASFVCAACHDVLGPARVLAGTWSSPDATLVATHSGADFFIPCIEAHFGPIAVDSAGGFHAAGVVTSAGGLVTTRAGDPFALSGQLLGGRVVIPWPWIVENSGADTLNPGEGSPHVCNA